METTCENIVMNWAYHKKPLPRSAGFIEHISVQSSAIAEVFRLKIFSAFLMHLKLKLTNCS